MLKPKSITLRGTNPSVSACVASIIDYVCQQTHPHFSTAEWAKTLDQSVLEGLNRLTLEAVKEIHGARAREAMELALMAAFAERHPSLVLAGKQVIQAAGGCAPEELTPAEARQAVGTLAFILHAEVGRRMGIVVHAPTRMFDVTPDLAYRREPDAENEPNFRIAGSGKGMLVH